MTHTSKRIMVLSAILISLLVYASSTNATNTEYHAQRNGIEQFCASSVTVVGTTYNFVGNCGTPPPPPGLWTVGNIVYPPHNGTVYNTDVTKWENFFGRTGASGIPVPFPGTSGATVQMSPPRNQYASLAFVVPYGVHSGQYKLASYYSSNNQDFSVATTQGTFGTTNTACTKVSVQATDQPFLFWDTGTVGTFKCHLVSGQRYYLNARPHTVNDHGTIGIIHQGS